MHEIIRLGAKLLSIAAVAGLALGATNGITQKPIEAQLVAAQEAARKEVLPAASSFALAACDGVEEAYVGSDGAGDIVGATGKLTVTGFGGPIELTVGVDDDGTITGVSVGGAEFAETAGLGAKTRDAAFTDQFIGADASVQLTKNGGTIDAVTSATISSNAVTGGVAAIVKAIAPLAKEGN